MGIVILPIVIISLAIAIAVVIWSIKTKGILFGLIVAITLILVPFGDEILGSIYMMHLCRTGIHTHTHNTAEDVASVVQEGDYGVRATTLLDWRGHGYRYLESSLSRKNSAKEPYTRYSIDEKGRLIKRGINRITSDFGFGWWDASNKLQKMLNIKRIRFLVRNRTTEQVFAESISFERYSGWLLRWISGGTWGNTPTRSCPGNYRADNQRLLIEGIVRPTRVVE